MKIKESNLPSSASLLILSTISPILIAIFENPQTQNLSQCCKFSLRVPHSSPMAALISHFPTFFSLSSHKPFPLTIPSVLLSTQITVSSAAATTPTISASSIKKPRSVKYTNSIVFVNEVFRYRELLWLRNLRFCFLQLRNPGRSLTLTLFLLQSRNQGQ